MNIEVTTPNDREILVTRMFNAPAQLVWDCHTKAGLVRRWHKGPDDAWTLTICDIDLKVGGAYHYHWKHPDGREFGFKGRFREILAPNRLVNTERFEDTPEGEGDAIVIQTFEDRGGKTYFSASMIFPSKEMRDMALESGMTRGIEADYDRIETMVQAMA